MFARFRRHWSALSSGERAAVAVWAGLLVGVFGRAAVASPRCQSVVPIYLAAGQRWAAAENLYDPVPDLDVYRNPPVVAAGFAALTPLPDKLAAALWRAVGVGVFLTGLVRFRRAVLPEWSADRAGWAVALAALVVLPAVNNGQVNLAVAGAVLHGTADAVRRRWWAAAGWFGGAGWLKLYPFAAGLLAAVVTPRAFGWRLAVVAAGGFAVPFALQDPAYVFGQYREFIVYLGGDDRTFADLRRVPLDWTIVPRVWAGWVVPAGAAQAVSLAAAAGAAAVVWGVAQDGADRRRPLGLAAALGAVWMTAFGPATEANTYTVLAAAAAHLCLAAGPRPAWATGMAWGGFGLLAATVLRGLFPADWQFQVCGPQPLAAVLLAPAAVATWLPAFNVRPTPVTSVVWVGRIGRPVGRIGGRAVPGTVARRPERSAAG